MKPNEVRNILLSTGEIEIYAQRGDGSFVARNTGCGFRVACCEKVSGEWVVKFYPYIDFEPNGCAAVRNSAYVDVSVDEYTRAMVDSGLVVDGISRLIPINDLSTDVLRDYVDITLRAHVSQYFKYMDEIVDQCADDEYNDVIEFGRTFMHSEINNKCNDVPEYIIRFNKYLYRLLDISTDSYEAYAIYSGGFEPVGYITLEKGVLKCNFMQPDGECLYRVELDDVDCRFNNRIDRMFNIYKCIKSLEEKIKSMEPKY